MLSIESQDGYFIFYDRNGNEVSKQMSAEVAIANIWQIKSGIR